VIQIVEAQSDEQIRRCFAVMKQLRTHLEEPDFVPRIRRQMSGGFRLAYLEEDGAVRAVAGFRIYENLSSGNYLYVDDLVTDADHRSKNFGGKIFDWLVNLARTHRCEALELDSGVQRFAAHRFYLRNGMDITSHHFALRLR
jgi:GNAT superfamily N-acetyltransferase